MDHKLAIVIVPAASKDPVQASAALLNPFQKVPADGVSPDFQPRFRFKRVGGWFDGLISGQVGQERWSTVLRMLLDGAATSNSYPLPRFGPETSAEIERRIEADNTIDLDDIWPLAPISIIVTPNGQWIAHPRPDYLDESVQMLADDGQSDDDVIWTRAKRAAFWEHRGATAVAWDLSWHFIGLPVSPKSPHSDWAPRPWRSSHGSSSTSPESWRARISVARAAATEARSTTYAPNTG